MHRTAKPKATTNSTKPHDENATSKASTTTKRSSVPNRTALGELTNKIVDKSKQSQAQKKPQVVVSTSRIALASRNILTGRRKAKGSEAAVPTVPKAAVAKAPEVTIFDEEILDRAIDLMDLDDKSEAESGVEWVEDHTAVEDIDYGDEDDPQFCTEYVTMIMSYCKDKEIEDRVNANYMALMQNEITANYRTILVDWLAEVAIKFKLLNETTFLGVTILDRYLERRTVSKKSLQLVGITAMLIACKYEEIYSPEINDFLWISAKAYTREQVLDLETDILMALDWNLAQPTALYFLRRYSKAARSDTTIHTLCKYLIELSLLEYSMLQFLPSTIAAAAVLLSRKMTGCIPAWNATLEHYTRFSESDVLECAKMLNTIKKKQEGTSKYQTITAKYNLKENHRVASIPAVDL